MADRTEFDIGEHTYGVRGMSVFAQLHVARKVAPLMRPLLRAYEQVHPGLSESEFMDAVEPLATAFSELASEDVDNVMSTCLSAVTRRDGDRWMPIYTNDTFMFADITLDVALMIVFQTIMDQLGPFINRFLSLSRPAAQEPESNG